MDNKNLMSKMLVFTCILFAPLTVVLDILIGFLISNTSLLNLGGTFIILVIDFSISAFMIIFKDNPPKILQNSKPFCYFSIIYTISIISLKIIVTIVNISQKIVWNTTVYSVILIFAFSVVIPIYVVYLKFRSFFLKAFTYFITIGIFYYLLTVTIGGLDVGNNLILILSLYVILFILIALIILLISSRKKRKILDSTPYHKQF